MRYIDYLDFRYRPGDDLICRFWLKAKDPEKAAGAVAAESSIGTWTETTTVKPYMLKYAAKVFRLEKQGRGWIADIAYPADLWEAGNLPGLLSGIAGNIFGMKEVDKLRLIDVRFPKKLLKTFPGPKFGIQGVRKRTGVRKRPLIGTIVKPKIGLKPDDHARVAFEAWVGGCDLVKDDENLVDQKFNRFRERLEKTLKAKERAERETGERKFYMVNVTAETQEMLKRARLAEDLGNEYIMADVIVLGWSAIQTLRNQDFNLILHAHRAGHAALDREEHGIKMCVIAKLVRLAGFDQLHVGTVVGKMFEGLEDVKENIKALKEDMGRIKPVMPVSSGGLHPGHVPRLLEIFGRDVIIQMGGGIHGHPGGTRAGARAARQALEASLQGIPLKEARKSYEELDQALKHWA